MAAAQVAVLPRAGRFQAAAEIVGHGDKVTSRFPDNELSDMQVPSNLDGLWAEPTPRIEGARLGR